MACTEKSTDGNLTVQYFKSYANGDGTPDYNARELPSAKVKMQLEALESNHPELWKQDLSAANKAMQEANILPGYSIVATRDENGIDRDAKGEPVMLSEVEIVKLAILEHDKIAGKAKAYTEMFDKFHEGFDGANPLQIIMPAKLTHDGIVNTLNQANLSPHERQTLEALRDEFYYISTRVDHDEILSREEISVWEERNQYFLDNKRDAFVTGDPATKRDPHLRDADGKISKFDWENKDECAVDWRGNAYIRMMTW